MKHCFFCCIFLFFTPFFAEAASPNLTNPNLHPDGTLIEQRRGGGIYLVQGDKKSLILRSIINKWLSAAHYFKEDYVVIVSSEEFNSYKEMAAVNLFYIGKILKSEKGAMYYIDSSLKRRPISPAVFKALKYSSRNIYQTTLSHISQFGEGTAITKTDIHPDGTVFYYGPYHGGQIFYIQNGKKRYFMNDYLYETRGFPWSSQILPLSEEEYKKYSRGENIYHYPSGVTVKDKKGNVYVVYKNTLRWIASAKILNTLNYNPKYILGVYPEMLKYYKMGEVVDNYKGIKATYKNLPDFGSLSPPSQFGEKGPLISRINDIFLNVADRPITPAENRYWIDRVYNGNIDSETELRSAMKAKLGIK